MEKHGSFVEACFYCPENENSVDGNIIVSREIYSNGRNMCKINGRMCTVNELREFMKNLIDIHGQNDNQTLLDTTYHIKYLDKYLQKEIYDIESKYKLKYEEYKNLKENLKNNYGDEKEKQRRLDLLKYQIKEINTADLKINEDIELEEQRRIMQNSERILINLQEVNNNLTNIAIDAINNSIRDLEKIEDLDLKYKEKLTELKSVYYEVQEIARDVSDYTVDINFEEKDRNIVEERLETIRNLKRKYGNSIEEILNYAENLRKEIEIIENAEEINNENRKRVEKLETELNILADKMHEIRINGGIILSEKINKELMELEMKNAKFNINIVKTNKFSSKGKDEVEFMIQTNKGEVEKPLSKIASGGEMSRIMLSIKTVFADIDEVPVLIFDEIDTGISGKAAKAVSEKLKKISFNHQILCITHLATIAASGDFNYYISKQVKNEKTITRIDLLGEEEIINEIARISNGDVTNIALENARELRKRICV